MKTTRVVFQLKYARGIFSNRENEEESAQAMFCSPPVGLMWLTLNSASGVTVVGYDKQSWINRFLYQPATPHNYVTVGPSVLACSDVSIRH